MTSREDQAIYDARDAAQDAARLLQRAIAEIPLMDWETKEGRAEIKRVHGRARNLLASIQERKKESGTDD